MKAQTKICLPIFLICLCYPATFGQQSDNAVIDKFIALQARRENGSEPDGVRQVATGDLNHDGIPDAAVLYTIEGQNGSNNYIQYLAVFVRTKGRLVYAARKPVGGKNHRALDLDSVKDNLMFFDTTDYAKTDPSCCPTIKGTTRFVLNAGTIREMSHRK